jgi:hypothetical protein
MKSLITAITVFLSGLFGCSKTTPPASTAKPAQTVQADSKIKDLGVLTMTNHLETFVKVGKDKDCRIVPNMMGRKDIELTLTLESKSAKGVTSGLSVVRLTGKPQSQFEVTIGDTDITFTPQIASE